MPIMFHIHSKSRLIPDGGGQVIQFYELVIDSWEIIPKRRSEYFNGNLNMDFQFIRFNKTETMQVVGIHFWRNIKIIYSRC